MEDSHSEIDEIEIKYFNHIDELEKINIIEYCLINKAIKKYEEQTKYNMRQWSYCQLSWLFKCCNDVLDIKKMNNRYVCSKDRLDAIDFRIIRNYQIKITKSIQPFCK